jgi:hypothetical protein
LLWGCIGLAYERQKEARGENEPIETLADPSALERVSSLMFSGRCSVGDRPSGLEEDDDGLDMILAMEEVLDLVGDDVGR